ncbi:ribbon-helix-helix protein, CopG family [Rhodococcus qingshengii]|uniref:ribbon-helix-helix protein, CopG family n=1 Tax=Rhodococcus qingshengii TaxID=334542 RepID=UPI0020169A87|nr:ribbon-helix-helix protein, CopG family [Rhodococcus qingshengii]
MLGDQRGQMRTMSEQKNEVPTSPAVDQTKPIRLSVNMNNETADALREIADRYGVSVTEAVRRAISVAHFVEQETRAGKTVQIEDPKTGKVRELVMM